MNPMRQRPENIWDRYRDGELSAADRAEFERYLRENAAEADLFERESRWLEELADTAGHGASPTDRTRFRAAVLDRLPSEEERTVRRSGVLARIGPAIAAAAAIALVGLIQLTAPRAVRPGETGQVTVVEARLQDPLSVLLSDVNEQIEHQPRQIRRAIDETASLLALDRLAGMIDLDQLNRVRGDGEDDPRG